MARKSIADYGTHELLTMIQIRNCEQPGNCPVTEACGGLLLRAYAEDAPVQQVARQIGAVIQKRACECPILTPEGDELLSSLKSPEVNW
jgi:hypothetical protein